MRKIIILILLMISTVCMAVIYKYGIPNPDYNITCPIDGSKVHKTKQIIFIGDEDNIKVSDLKIQYTLICSSINCTYKNTGFTNTLKNTKAKLQIEE